MFQVLKEALTITAFVFVMMLLIEYLNVLTQGQWQARLKGAGWGQYVLASALGALPGCLGPFAVVSLYAHRMVSFGGVVAAMIATSGDETFLMLAVIPKQGLLIMLVLFIVGIGVGWLVDRMMGRKRLFENVLCEGYVYHPVEQCEGLPGWVDIKAQWSPCSVARGGLCVSLLFLILTLVTGTLGPEKWNWIRVTLLALCLLALFIVVTVPDHFLEEHFWRHVVLRHVPRVFFWTFGIMIALFFLMERYPLGDVLEENQWGVLALASLVGLIPESGPHYVFVTLYAQGLIPLAILLANSIVQDGHGMLPLLAYSRKAFFGIKIINLIAGLLLGAATLALGF